jgi:hypothetical protein
VTVDVVDISPLRQRLLDRACEQIRKDVETGDLTAIEELLKNVSSEALQTFLPEDEWIHYPTR